MNNREIPPVLVKLFERSDFSVRDEGVDYSESEEEYEGITLCLPSTYDNGIKLLSDFHVF